MCATPGPRVSSSPAQTHTAFTHVRFDTGGPVVPLRAHQGSARTDHAPDVPPTGGGRGEHPGRRSGDPRRQPPDVHRLDDPAAGLRPAGLLHRQGRVRHRQGPQGPADGLVLHRRRHDPGGPGRRPRRRRGADDRPPGAGGGQDLRHLPRGHPLPRRPAVPGPYRHRPADPDDGRARGAVRDDRHGQAPAGRRGPARGRAG